MVETIFQLKRSPGNTAPTTLLFGEPAWVEATNTLYIGKSNGTAIGIPFGASYQPSSVRLNEIAALSPTNGAFVVGNGSSFILQSGASARSLLGLGSAAIASTTDFVSATEKGIAGGVAILDITGKVPTAQLPATNIPVLSVFGRTGTITAQPGDYTAPQVGALAIANNLSDLNNAAIARTNLGLGSAATASTTYLLDRANHTGTQAMSTIAELQTALDNKLSGSELDAHLSAPILDHPDGSVTDIKIGNRTVVDTAAPTSLGPGSLTQWLQWIVNRIKAITGKPNWWDTPATTLQTTAIHIASTSNPHQVTAAQVGAIATTQLGIANGVATLDSTGKVLTSQLPALGAVQSVFGRTGTITAQIGDYTAAQVGAIPTTEKGAANGIATLDSAGKIPTSQIPPIAINDTFPVNSEAEMLALTAEVGDVAVRLDSNQSFILRLPGASTLSNWQEMLTKTGVTSVFGRGGAVGAQSGDYTTDQITEGARLYFTEARSRSSLSVTAPLSYDSNLGIFSLPIASGAQDGYFSSANFTKLAGIAAGATANSTDAFLLSRANHTGLQSYTTITGLGAAATLDNTTATWNANQLQGRAIATTAPTTGQSLRWNGTSWEPATPTVTSANISDASTVGRSVLTGDAAAGRTTLGAVAGPASSTNGAIALYNGTTGALLQNSPLTINSTTIFSTNGQLGLSMSGDAFGGCALFLRNRNGSNGAIFQNLNLDLVDFGFLGSSNAQGNMRYEHRAGATLSGNSAGEFQFFNYAPTLGSAFLRMGEGQAAFSANVAIASTTASTSTTTGALTVAGGVGISGNVNIGGTLSVNGTPIQAGGGGPSTTTTNAIARYSNTTGTLANSSVTISDSGNLLLNVASSSVTTPRIFGFSSFGAGTAAQLQFGDEFNSLQSGYAKALQIRSYHQLELWGGTYGSPVVFNDAQSTYGVIARNSNSSRKALTARMATGQSVAGFSVEYADGSDAFKVDASGSTYISTSGSTFASPRVFGFTDFSGGQAVRVELGDAMNSWQCGYAGAAQINSYHQLEFNAGKQDAAASFTSFNNAYGVIVRNSQGTRHALTIVSAATQQASSRLFRVETNAGSEIFSISNTGAATISDTTASTSTATGALMVAGGVGIGGATNIGGNAAIAGRVQQGAPSTAPTDANLANSQLSFWVDEATSTLKVRVKLSDGTLKTGSISLV